ncbi:MAG: hypothetical protein M1831_003035 [Alyxoria varia]|nr:MAG: hypothetical protein M1831_003035 [Alyxoria varia]
MTAMVHQRPQSPHDDLQYGFNHLAQHDAQWQDNGGFGNSGQPTFSSSLMSQNGPPQSDFYMNQGYGGGQYHEVPHDGGFGIGVQYTGFDASPQVYYLDDGQGYHNLAYLHAGMQEVTPMTPGSNISDSTRRTRSGRSATRSSSPRGTRGENNRVNKSRVKKPKASKTMNNKTPKLNAPLSELTKDMADIPVRDMEQWVNRADDQRHQEVEKRNGYVTRPMNSFMLYRSAYADRTKQWCLQNNHQVVSAVSGESWPLEPKEVRDFYNNLAKIERDNHAHAHPSYKFSPSKTTPAASNAASRKKKGADLSDEEEDDGFDVDPHDMDGEWRPRNERRGNNGNSGVGRRRQGREAGFPAYMHHQVPPPMPQQHSGFFMDDPQYGIVHSGINGINDTIASSPWSDMMSDGGRPNTALPGGFTEMYGNSPFSSAFHSPAGAMAGSQLPMDQPQPDMLTSNPFQQQFQQQQRQQNAMPTAIPGMSDAAKFFRSNAPSPAPPHATQHAPGEGGYVDPLLLHSPDSPRNTGPTGAKQSGHRVQGGAATGGEHSGAGRETLGKAEGETAHNHHDNGYDIFGDNHFSSEGDAGRDGDGGGSAAHKGLEEWMEETSTS